jgi:pimeloyl-ACP methyl ester carboxylesterase
MDEGRKSYVSQEEHMIFQNWQAKVRPMFRAMLLVFCLSITSAAEAASNEAQKPITLKTMGSLFFGGTVTRAENGETFHGDHGYAQYYIPQNSRNYPLVMWHGIGQSGKTYESTPDGREGFMSILPRRDWPVYIIDQPRRGRTQAVDAARVSVPTTERESAAWDAFRLGVWTPPDPAYLFSTLQFPRDPATIDQFFRQQTPDTGAHPRTAEHRAFMGKTVAELFRQTGPGILITHSHSGQYGWTTAMAAPELIKAIVAYEPGQFAFPEGERPAEIPSKNDLVNEAMQPQPVPLEEFKKLTKMPILVIYGDNISKDPSTIFNVDLWRVASARAKQFVDAVNRHGGDAQLVLLPDIGMKGNTHIPFADLNNVQIAEHLEKFLQSKGLDGRNQPHNGPAPKKMESYTIPLQRN